MAPSVQRGSWSWTPKDWIIAGVLVAIVVLALVGLAIVVWPLVT